MGLTGDWDGRISRRALLRAGGSATAAYVLLGRSARPAQAVQTAFPFGIASGDPTPDGFVLWTRVTPAPPAAVAEGLRYEIAADEGFKQIVRRGATQAPQLESYSVHAEIAGLQPDTWYWYRFNWRGYVSGTGRTRTTPAPGTTRPLRFAYVSCQNYTNGFYGAYADLVKQDVDLVVHLGDYIYEGPGIGAERVRDHDPVRELFSLTDYRTRHAQYKRDRNLQAAHAQFPFLMTWDDHEFKDNYADLDLEPDVPLPTAEARRAAAYLAYWEHSPLARARKPVGKDMPLYRRAAWGDLATFHVLDTRQYRSNQIEACLLEQLQAGYCPDALVDTRGILGEAQRDWLFSGLTESGGTWNVLANQVAFAPFVGTNTEIVRRHSYDSWDGYVGDRERVLDFLRERGLKNTVVITGDAHEHGVRNVPPSFESLDGIPVATEFMGTSLTSEGYAFPYDTRHGPTARNPHQRFVDRHRGYVVVTLDPTVWKADFRGLDDVRKTNPVPSTVATYICNNGEPGGVRA